MKKIFEKTIIGGIELKNRLIRSATQEGAADEHGNITEQLLSIYEIIAAGGVGATITSMVGIDENSRAFPYMIKAYGDDFASGLKLLIRYMKMIAS